MKTKKKKQKVKQEVYSDLKRQLESSRCYQKVGNNFITLLHIHSNMTYTCVFCILEFDEDEDDLSSEDNDDEDDEDNDDDDDEDYEDKQNAFSSTLKNKNSDVIPDKKGIVGSGLLNNIIWLDIVL